MSSFRKGTANLPALVQRENAKRPGFERKTLRVKRWESSMKLALMQPTCPCWNHDHQRFSLFLLFHHFAPHFPSIF